MILLALLWACTTDEAAPDADGDGFQDTLDCDDGDKAIFPGADEVCNGLDDDCDSFIDENPEDGGAWYGDADGDGFGDPTAVSDDCAAPNGSVTNASDCNDYEGTINPQAAEACNGLDDDCDGLVDDGAGFEAYTDVDGDGFGDDATLTLVCELAAGQVTVGGDCVDSDADTWPGAPEACDGLDRNCDGAVDGGFRVPDDYATIQAAADAAPDGATVCVSAGATDGPVRLDGRSLAIVGKDGSEVVGGGVDPVLWIRGGVVTVQSLSLIGGTAAVGAGLRVEDATVTLDGVSVVDSVFSGGRCGGAVELEDAGVVATELSVTGTSATCGWDEELEGTGAVRVRGGSLDWTGGTVSGVMDFSSGDLPGTDVPGLASGVYADGATLRLSGVTLEGNELSCDVADLDTGAILGAGTLVAEGSVVELEDVAMSGNIVSAAESGLGARVGDVVVHGGTLTVDGLTIESLVASLAGDDEADQVAGLLTTEAGFTIDGLWITEAAVQGEGVTGALLALTGGEGTVTHLDVRGGSVLTTVAPSYAAGVRIEPEGAVTVENFFIAGNTFDAQSWIGVGPVWSLGEVSFLQGDVTGNVTDGYGAYSGAFTLVPGTWVSGVNIVGNSVTDAGYGTNCWGGTVVWSASVTDGTFDHVDVYGNTGTRFGTERVDATCGTAELGAAESIAADPLYVDVSGEDPTGWDLHLGAGSPAIDAGDPASVDVDGTRADLGGYGGVLGGW